MLQNHIKYAVLRLPLPCFQFRSLQTIVKYIGFGAASSTLKMQPNQCFGSVLLQIPYILQVESASEERFSKGRLLLLLAVVLVVVVLAAAPLASTIPLAVLAGIALKVGIDIIDWEFLKRAHHLSIKAAVITYGVIALTVLVDLITAVGIGVFVANVLTIDRMSALQSKKVKTISTADDDVELTHEEQALLDRASGRVLLFQLAGPMIFGVAKAIAREHNAIGNCKAVVFDLSEVSHLGVTAAIALENAVKEAMEVGRHVYLVGATGSTENRLRKLKLLERLPQAHISSDRLEALRSAVAGLGVHA